MISSLLFAINPRSNSISRTNSWWHSFSSSTALVESLSLLIFICTSCFSEVISVANFIFLVVFIVSSAYKRQLKFPVNLPRTLLLSLFMLENWQELINLSNIPLRFNIKFTTFPPKTPRFIIYRPHISLHQIVTIFFLEFRLQF